jgi:hypothetical protein
MRLYGQPTKLVQSVSDREFTIEPQRYHIIPFWHADDAESYVDGENTTKIAFPLGSKVVSHHIKQTLTPETIEPQELYMGIIKLSFDDWLTPSLCGKELQITSGGTVSSEANRSTSLQFFSDHVNKHIEHPTGDQTLDIDTIRNDDELPHWLRTKSDYVYDQSPMLGSRYMRVPAKCKRINRNTWYGLFIFNDSERGGTPADTAIKYRIKQKLKVYVL